jgi:hypothetical protein
MDQLYTLLLGERTHKNLERGVLYLSVVGFLIHLLLIYLVQWGGVDIQDRLELLQAPISAAYTPFTFILVYEVYLLVYYLPHSITTYIAKQYEIITLIIIRRVFKDMASLDFTDNWFSNTNDLQFTYDVGATLALFFLLFLFTRLGKRSNGEAEEESPNQVKPSDNLDRFIRVKKYLSAFLVPVLIILAVYTFTDWLFSHLSSVGELVSSLKDINKVFFDEFFTILILVDVLLLLISLLHTDEFHKVMRNSGFIISTVLIRLSFGVDGLLSILLIVGAVIFGVLILAIHNLFEYHS